ncbi:hypothetical protein [Paenibacillus selenitireducens]|nr:hypothetical protein [Paenibacillus selenitireducens]
MKKQVEIHIERHMMKKIVLMLLEFLRIIIMMFFFVSIVTNLERSFYEPLFHWYGEFHFPLFVGNFMLFLVWYRNRLQFSGWFTHDGQEKLSRKMTRIMLGCAVFFILIPVFYTYYIHL